MVIIMEKELKNRGRMYFVFSLFFLLLTLVSLLTTDITVYATDITTFETDFMLGYKNPEDIIISTPKDKFSTKASKVSILGASDYRYPIYMNGELIETTTYGFFTIYVDLEVGVNEFIFENNDKLKILTITRKKSASGGSSSSSGSSSNAPKETYKAYTSDVYGTIKSNYAMPRRKINASDITLMPITKGSTFRILGEDGSYYKIVDGTYVSKSSVTRFNKTLGYNKVSKAVISDDTTNNLFVTKLTMNINTMHAVTVEGQTVHLKLYDTVSLKKPALPSNDTIRDVIVSVDKENKTATYSFTLYEDAVVNGYDISFRDGSLIFELKKAPHLKIQGSLRGAKVYLDAGHGGTDTGALGPLSKYGPTEKNINLAITLYTKEYLENLGATVIMTRSEDTSYSLTDRVTSIRNTMPDISVSIHGNSLDLTSDYSKTSGFITYYSYRLFQNVPDLLNKSISKALNFQEKAPRSSSLSLTRLTACPAILLETSFLSNPLDYEYLIQDINQKKFGDAIGEAVKEYIEGIAVYEGEQIIHIVQKGETLSSIAKKYGVLVSDIIELNDIENINHILVGQKIKINL